jgi:predicted choloylglycine hydrolase
MSRKLVIRGSHKEVGEQIGLQYKEWGKKEVFIPPLINDYYQKQRELYEKFFPLYIEYLDGVAEGLGIDTDLVLKSYLAGFLHVANKPDNKCSVFALKNDNGVFVGRNYDWLEASEKHSKMLHFEFTDNSSNNITGVSDMGTWEWGMLVGSEKFVFIFDEAWNEHGLYIALNGAPGKKKDIGISTPHVVQLIAEQCKTTEEAVSLLTKIPTPDSKTFTIADKNGKFAVVEKSLEKGTKVRESNDFIIATNHFMHPELESENAQIFDDVPFHSTFPRYAYLEYNLPQLKGTIDLPKIHDLMSKPPVLQNWRGKENGDALTIWINALNLRNLEYRIQFAPLLGNDEWIK